MTELDLILEECPFSEEIQAISLFKKLVPNYGSEGAFYFRRSRPDADSFPADETILAFDPLETIRIEGQNPYPVLSERLSHYRIRSHSDSAQFRGGFFGYFSYDSVRFLEPILTRGEGNLAHGEDDTSVYDAELMFFRKLIVLNHKRKRVQLISFVGSEQERQSFSKFAKEAKANLVGEKAKTYPLDLEIETSKMNSLQGKPAFIEKVLTLKEHIAQGDIFQAVLSERFEQPFSGNPIDLFGILSVISPAPYQYCFLTGGRAFLGASPEMLLKIKSAELETRPIAGTRPRGKDALEERKLAEELLADVKEKAEHLMLVDLARNDLGRVAKTGSVRVESFQKVQKFGGVMHLVSRVKAGLKSDQSAIQAFASCFPAGTLSGAPKIRAMQLLSRLEPKRRGFYGGAVVMAELGGDLDSCISIRSVELSRGLARIQAGAGIVADSSPELEYQEVQYKTKAVRRALAIAESQVHGSSHR